jgi:hypothetical protein
MSNARAVKALLIEISTLPIQAADEMRRVQRIAYRTAQVNGGPVDAATLRRQQTAWEEAPALQPLRELIEYALITYDWDEAFIVTKRSSSLELIAC